MNKQLQALTNDELVTLLNQERKKFIVAIDYGSSASDLEEIKDYIKELESLIASRQALATPVVFPPKKLTNTR